MEVEVLVEVEVPVEVEVLVEVEVGEVVLVLVVEILGVRVGVLLSLGQVAPTQHLAPSSAPPLGQLQDAQQPLPQITPCNRRAEPPLQLGAQ